MSSYVRQCSLTCLVIFGVQVVLGGYERNCDYYQPRRPLGRCGKELADLIKDVCMYYYGGKKRSSEPPVVENPKPMHTWRAEHDLPLDPNIFMPKHKAVALLRNNKRGASKGRISCECCQYQCNIHELSQYCSIRNFKRSTLNNIVHHSSPGGHSLINQQSDLQDKQKIGHLLRKHGPEWLGRYLVHMQALDVVRDQVDIHNDMMHGDDMHMVSDDMHEAGDAMHVPNDDYMT